MTRRSYSPRSEARSKSRSQARRKNDSSVYARSRRSRRSRSKSTSRSVSRSKRDRPSTRHRHRPRSRSPRHDRKHRDKSPSMSRSRSHRRNRSQNRSERNESRPQSLLVRNLNPKTTADELRRAFSRRPGDIRDVYIPRDHTTNESRSFAFVEFRDAREAREVKYEMDRTELGGKEIAVLFAQQRRKTPDQMRDMLKRQQEEGSNED